MKIILSKLAFLTAAVLTFPAIANPSAAEQLQKVLNNVNTYEATFHQEIKDAQGAEVAETEGKMLISRPHKFYWKSNTPDEIIVIADGKHLWNYDVDLAQVTQQKQAPVIKNSPAGLLAGDTAQLTKAFQVNMAKPQQCKSKVDQCFTLEPKEADAGYSHIILGFQDQKLIEIRMKDNLGQNVLTLFKQPRINHSIDNKIFQFKPPKGVDIIHADH